jgi:endonuclease YncB( thermonuclease family)
MFAKRKNQDGFEWHKYVRTTIKVRREQRRQRVVEARQAAAKQVGAAGVALAAGSKAAGAAAVDGARAGFGVAGLLAQAAWHMLLFALAAIWSGLAYATMVVARQTAVIARPVARLLAQPKIGGPVALAGAIALGLGVGRYRTAGADGEAMITLGVGLALLICALPMVSAATGFRMPSLPVPSISPRAGGILVAVAMVAAGAAWFMSGGRTNLAGITGSITSQLPLVGGAKPLQGRAQAVGGDSLRVGNTTVRLAGLEAPERQQRCGNRRCGAGAEAALSRLVNGRSISCKLSGSDSAGRPLATCVRGDADVGAELIRQGHAFAAGGFFSSYANAEREARNAKAGIWSSGEPERPADYRARVGKRNS